MFKPSSSTGWCYELLENIWSQSSWIQANTTCVGWWITGAMIQVDTGTDARTDGTQRAFTEAQLKRCCNVGTEGGDPSMIMLGSFNKQKLSGFTGGSTKNDFSRKQKTQFNCC